MKTNKNFMVLPLVLIDKDKIKWARKKYRDM